MWVTVRPLGDYGFWRRIKFAWGVITGKYDVVEWEDQ